MKKFLVVGLLSIHLAISLSPAQPEHLSWKSLHRLSFAVSTAYYFNPWENYNQILDKITHQIMINPLYVNPIGSYDRIRGDVMYAGKLRYRFMDHFNLGFILQYGKSSSLFEFYPDPSITYDDGASMKGIAFHQTMRFTLYSIGPELSYHYTFRKWISLQASGGLDRYQGQVDLDWQMNTYTSGPVDPNDAMTLNSKMRDSAWGWHAALEFHLPVMKAVSVSTGIIYRHALFENLTGNAEFENSFGEVRYQGELVESSKYFGFADPDDSFFSLPVMWLGNLDEPYRPFKPAVFNLNSVGIQLGIIIGF